MLYDRLDQDHCKSACADHKPDVEKKELPPGNYRALSSFEYSMPDGRIMKEAKSREVKLEPRTGVTYDLDLYVIQ